MRSGRWRRRRGARRRQRRGGAQAVAKAPQRNFGQREIKRENGMLNSGSLYRHRATACSYCARATPGRSVARARFRAASGLATSARCLFRGKARGKIKLPLQIGDRLFQQLDLRVQPRS